MPARRIRRARPTATEEVSEREHPTARHKRNGHENGKTGVQSLYERARQSINNGEISETINLIQHRATRIFHNGETEAHKITSQLSLLTRMVKERWDEHRDLPWRTVTAFTVAIMYFIGPLDIVPDFIPGVGFLDDAIVLALCFRLIKHDLKEYAMAEGIELKAYGL